jgi:hypothetical protein
MIETSPPHNSISRISGSVGAPLIKHLSHASNLMLQPSKNNLIRSVRMSKMEGYDGRMLRCHQHQDSHWAPSGAPSISLDLEFSVLNET